MSRSGAGLVCGIILLSSACTANDGTASVQPPPAPQSLPARRFAAVDAPRLLAADEPANSGQWMSYGRDYDEQRFSPLTDINTRTVKNLGLAWFADFDTRRGQE